MSLGAAGCGGSVTVDVDSGVGADGGDLGLTLDGGDVGTPDMAVATSSWCVDVDQDGFGDPGDCTDVPDGQTPPQGSVAVSAATDCDDDDEDTFPGAAPLDDADACMTDADGDDFGDAAPSATNAVAGTDCDDSSVFTFAGAAQIEGTDACMLDADDDGYGEQFPPAGVTAGTDCDDADNAVFLCTVWCLDMDMDGQGDPTQCVGVAPGGTAPTTHVDNGDDCADDASEVFVGAAEQEPTLCTADADDDGYGDAAITDTVPSATNGTDCLDSDADTFVGAAEQDSTTDCMRDVDGDGWGDDAPPAGVVGGRDCDDDDGDRVVCVTAAPVCVGTNLGEGVQLNAVATGGDGTYTWLWDNADTLDQATIPNAVATPTAITTYSVTVTDGAGNSATSPITVHLTNVNWVLGGAEADCVAVGFMGSAAPHSFADQDTTTCTTANADPTAYVCPTVHENARITGTMSVAPPVDDDDFIGVVWGYQDADHYYLLTWKLGAQIIGGCNSAAGMTVKRVDRVQEYTYEDFSCNTDTPNTTVLMGPAQTTTAGWVHGVTYSVDLRYTNTSTEITVVDTSTNTPVASFTVSDGTYPRGQFGTFDFSQIRACNGPWTSSCLVAD